MSRPEDVVREALNQFPSSNVESGWNVSRHPEALAALDELVRERDDALGERVIAQLDIAQARVQELTELCRRMSEQVDELAEQRIQRNARVQELEAALRAIAFNARAWHGVPNENDGHTKALSVIANWAENPDLIPEGVGGKAKQEVPNRVFGIDLDALASGEPKP